MKNGLVIADSGSIFSLAVIDKLDILSSLFDEIKRELGKDKFYRNSYDKQLSDVRLEMSNATLF
jgi:predicted nucleic acid-binding protein